MTIHGRTGTFGTDLLGPAAPSGQLLTSRAVPSRGWPVGRNGIFNAVTDTVFTQGGNTDIADDMFEPARLSELALDTLLQTEDSDRFILATAAQAIALTRTVQVIW